MKTVLRVISIIVLALVSVACIGLDAWYAYIVLLAPEKVVSQTYKVGLQTLEDGTQKPIAEIKLFNNAYEFKWNYILDESRQNFYSQGVQFLNGFQSYYLTDTSTEIKTDNGKHFGAREEYFSYCGRYAVSSPSYQYASNNDYADTLGSTNPITDDTLFKLTMQVDGEDKIFGMKFKGGTYDDGSIRNVKVGATARERIVPQGLGTYETQIQYTRGRFNQIDAFEDHYVYYDFNYFLYSMYDAIQTLEPGTNHNIAFEYGDLFDYYEYDEETSTYSKSSVDLAGASKISAEVKSYYVIKCTIVDGDLTKASESLFKCVAGNRNYNSTGDYLGEDYFIGRTLVTARLDDFDFVKVRDNAYCLKLSDTFNKKYLKFTDSIYLDVVIDLDAMSKKGYEFAGFSEDSGLTEYTVHKCVTRKTDAGGGHVTESEVEYE